MRSKYVIGSLTLNMATLLSACIGAVDYPLVNPVDPASGLDYDGDGVENKVDTCPRVANPNQEKDCFVWVFIDGGAFAMGSNDGDSDERPVHTVQVASFEMARTEVTIGQYEQCVEAGRCTDPGGSSKCNWGRLDRDDYPVNCVTWDQARAYAEWVGGRLPTEAEWEFAARSRGQAIAYPWGEEQATCDLAIMNDGGGRGCGTDLMRPVCSSLAGNTEQGLCDMAGGVWEWVEDRYGIYDDAFDDGSARTDGGAGRVFRGGSWVNATWSLRAANRNRNQASSWYDDVGFRPARSSP